MQKSSRKLTVHSAASLLSVIASCAVSYGATVPSDFALHAHVAPGGGPAAFDVSSSAEAAKLPKPWDLKFNASGRGQSVVSHFVLRSNRLDVEDVRHAVSISPGQLLNLVSAVNKADFYSLPGDLCTEPLEHTGGTHLKITMNGRTHEVDLCAWAMQRDIRSAKRLEQIWRALLSAWRSPNGNGELHWFKEGSGGLFNVDPLNTRDSTIVFTHATTADTTHEFSSCLISRN